MERANKIENFTEKNKIKWKGGEKDNFFLNQKKDNLLNTMFFGWSIKLEGIIPMPRVDRPHQASERLVG